MVVLNCFPLMNLMTPAMDILLITAAFLELKLPLFNFLLAMKKLFRWLRNQKEKLILGRSKISQSLMTIVSTLMNLQLEEGNGTYNYISHAQPCLACYINNVMLIPGN